MRKVIAFAGIVSLLMLAGSSYAERHMNWGHHRNLAMAQKFMDKAYDKISAAQAANEYDMGGHAQKAKELLEQANAELVQAAEAASHHGRGHDRDRGRY